MSVNNHDLDLALRWGSHCVSNILDRDNQDIPFFICVAVGKPYMRYDPRFSVANVTGRGLYALLQAEDALRTPADPKVVAAYRRVLFESYQLVRGLPANPLYPGGPYRAMEISSNGAAFRGLLGLWQFRGDQKARGYFEEGVYNWQNYFVAPGFSWRAFRDHFHLSAGGLGDEGAWPGPGDPKGLMQPFSIWCFLKFYEATGHTPALRLANELAEEALERNFPPDGSLGAAYDHGFEPAAEMNALAQLAGITKNAFIMERVRARYDNGIRAIRSRTGWVPERISRKSDVGEINNTAEVIEAAIKLGDWGWPQYYQDAERFTRSHLLPAQLLDTSFVAHNPSPASDGERDVAERARGAWGFPAPYGHISTRNPYFEGGFFFDIVGGGLATVAEIKRNTTRFEKDTHVVNLLFDTDNRWITVADPYPNHGVLRVILTVPGNLRVRLSDWVDARKLAVCDSAAPLDFTVENHYLAVRKPPLKRPIDIYIPLAVYTTEEVINGRIVRTRWKGDSVLQMTGHGTPYAFFAEYADAYRGEPGDEPRIEEENRKAGPANRCRTRKEDRP